ncbi:RNA polymerase sigma-70 factor [Chitinophaga defluvii]|uniref:RNA polymerase sigma-70 factor n=1 Tax=Chitinophaga defluvii TaxID=3163343 RepID=A0ABV2TCD2_9BACT
MEQTEFDQVFRTYFGALCRYAQTIVGNDTVAEDVVEEMFVKIWQHRKIPINNIRSYLYTSTRNACLDHLRSAVNRIMITGEPDEDTLQSEHPEIEMLKTEVYRQLLEAIAQLPERCGKIITLSYLEGLPSKDIGAQMNISIGTVDSQKFRGLQRLRKLLSNGALQLLMSLMAG